MVAASAGVLVRRCRMVSIRDTSTRLMMFFTIRCQNNLSLERYGMSISAMGKHGWEEGGKLRTLRVYHPRPEHHCCPCQTRGSRYNQRTYSVIHGSKKIALHGENMNANFNFQSKSDRNDYTGHSKSVPFDETPLLLPLCNDHTRFKQLRRRWVHKTTITIY